jgi:hypothetical protein
MTRRVGIIDLLRFITHSLLVIDGNLHHVREWKDLLTGRNRKGQCVYRMAAGAVRASRMEEKAFTFFPWVLSGME